MKIFNHMSTQQSRVLKALSSLHASYPQLGVVTYEEVIEKFHIYQRLWGGEWDVECREVSGMWSVDR